MYITIYRLYVTEGRLTIKNLENAVLKGWITEEEKGFMIQERKNLLENNL